jgi:hypothetical protein
VALDIPLAVWEHEVQLALRTGELPCAQRVDHDRRQWHFAPGRIALGRTDCVQAIGALPHVEHLALEVDPVPGQPAQLTSAEACEHRRQKQRPPCLGQIGQSHAVGRAQFQRLWAARDAADADHAFERGDRYTQPNVTIDPRSEAFAVFGEIGALGRNEQRI